MPEDPGDPRSALALCLQREGVASSAIRCRLAAGVRELTGAEVRRLADDPDERTWLDTEGAVWVLEPDRRRAEAVTPDGLRLGLLRCRDHPPRKRQEVRWTGDFTLGTLTDEDIEVIVRVAVMQRSAKQWQRIADDMLATGRLSVVSTSTRRLR